MGSNNSKLTVIDEQGSSGANNGVQAGKDIHGNVHNYSGAERPENEKVSSSYHQFPPASEFFCGREEVLLKVEKSIADCEKEEVYYRRIVAIIGLGGMGKSEIAKQLAKRLQPKYDFIFWFNAQIRTSLESGFKQLASILNVSLPSEDSLKSILPDVYRHLADNYRKAIFVFDNAEQLKREPGICGLEEYLVPNLQCKKPVFLITSRYPWGSVRQEIKCIPLDRLSDDESYKCLLKYMHVEDPLLPTSLKETTVSLSRRLGGYPLLLSLVGGTVADKADKISLDTMESRVQSYVKLLEGQSLEDVCGESKYEETLQLIFNLTVRNIDTSAEGKIAVELLNIIALLSPDSIYAWLVNGIYCMKRFEPHYKLCPRFDWKDLETSVSVGLKILMKKCLIKIQWETYLKDGVIRNYAMIRVHMLFQISTQNRLISGGESVAALEKMIRYCEHNELDLDHIRFLMNFLIQHDLSHLKTCWLLLLSAQLRFYSHDKDDIDYRELFWKVTDFLRSMKLDPDSDNTLCVLEILCQEPGGNREAWSKVKRFMLKLSPGFAKQRWVVQLSCEAFTYFCNYNLQEGNNADFCDWFLKNWKECKEDYNPGIQVLLCFLHGDSDLDWCTDPELISKVFASIDSAEETKICNFWFDIWIFIIKCTTKQQFKLLELLVNGPEGNFFASSLRFSQDSSKEFFVKRWAHFFCDCIIKVVKLPELRSSLLGNKGFVDSFWNITSFTLKNKYTSGLMIKLYWKEEAIPLIGTWCFIFHHDVAVYECFGRKMDSEIQDFLRRLHLWSRDTECQYLDYIREFADVKHCSEDTRNWIQEMLEGPKPKSRNWIQRIFKI